LAEKKKNQIKDGEAIRLSILFLYHYVMSLLNNNYNPNVQ